MPERAEQREYPRFHMVHQITYECFDPNGIKTDVGNAHTVNISDRGALIEMTRGVELDASLILWIREPFHTILVKGNVVHSRGVADGLFHVGVKLTDIIEGSWEIWKRLVELRGEEPTE